MNTPRHEQLWRMVLAVPYGRVVSYGALGRALLPPVSGLTVGRWMRACDLELPWWRVVGVKGDILIAKLDAGLGVVQERKLTEEGVEFEDGLVAKSAFVAVSEE